MINLEKEFEGDKYKFKFVGIITVKDICLIIYPKYIKDFENETFTQTDTFSFIKAIALMKKQSVSEEFFDIVPEMEVMYYGMPETEYAIRKEKNMALNKQNEIQGIFNLQNEDLSKMM